LLDLLGPGEMPFVSAFLALFHLGAEKAMVSRSGHPGFSHDDFRQAFEVDPTDP
jgi:hypothetical protein